MSGQRQEGKAFLRIITFKLDQELDLLVKTKVHDERLSGRFSGVIRNLLINHWLKDCRIIPITNVRDALERKFKRKLSDKEEEFLSEVVKAVAKVR